MARRAAPTPPETLRPAMARHLRELGLAGPDAYLRWCEAHAFAASLQKGPAERVRELDIARAERDAATRRTRARRNPRTLIADACAGRIQPQDVDSPTLRAVVEAIAASRDAPEERASLAAFLSALERKCGLVFATTTAAGGAQHHFIDALVRLHARRGQWLRQPDDWRPASHNDDRQFAALARHLLARYPVPAFMDEAWFRRDRGAHRFRDWFVHMARGKNIRSAKTHYPMTKMVAHHFANAPPDVTIEGALMLADIQSLGGGRRVASALMGTRLGRAIERDPERRAFWLSVYRFFIANPMLDLRHAGPIVDYLAHQKFESQEVMVGPGRVEVRPPPQPHLTMARRTPEALLRQVEAWHGVLRVQRANDRRFWRASGIDGLALSTGPRDDAAAQTHWRARELLSGQELIDEGRVMKHCVSTYAQSCAKGVFSIWSLTRRKGDAAERALTVAIDADRAMVEARGPLNRAPTEEERAVLQAWMRRADLRPGPYLYGWG